MLGCEGMLSLKGRDYTEKPDRLQALGNILLQCVCMCESECPHMGMNLLKCLARVGSKDVTASIDPFNKSHGYE